MYLVLGCSGNNLFHKAQRPFDAACEGEFRTSFPRRKCVSGAAPQAG